MDVGARHRRGALGADSFARVPRFGVTSLTIAAGILLALIAWLADGWTSALVIACITGSAIQGLRLGAIEMAGLALGAMLAILLAGPLGRAMEGGISAITGLHGLLNRAVSIAIVGLGILALAGVSCRLILRAIFPKDSTGQRRNSRLGGVLGVVQGICLSMALLWVLLAIEPVALARLAPSAIDFDPQREQYIRRTYDQAARQEPIAAAVVNLAGAIKQTFLGQMAGRSNPIAGVRILALSEAFAAVTRDPYAMRNFVASDAITSLRRLKSYQDAVTLAWGDVELNHFFTDEGVDAVTLQALASNDTILMIMDTTTILADIEPLAGQIEQAVYSARDQIGRRPDDTIDPEIDDYSPGVR